MPKIEGFDEFFATSCCDAYLNSEFWSTLPTINLDNYVARLMSISLDSLFYFICV